MTKVVFEAAALADALKKADKVAPTKGSDFDKAAGIVIEIGKDDAVIKATDTRTRFATWLTPESIEGEPVTWRLPSRVFSEVIGKLKTTLNKTLTLEQDGNIILLTHGKSTRARFSMIIGNEYPNWMPFSPDDMHEVEALASTAAAVQWACSKGTDVPLTGINFDGETAIACDKYRFAVMPLKMDLQKDITVPAGALSDVLRANETVLVRNDGSQMFIMPDEFTQISLTIYGIEYPLFRKVMRRDYPRKVKVNKSSLIDMLELAATMTGSERLPTMRLIFGNQAVAAMMENEQIGLLGHIVETPGQLDFTPRHEIRFKPEYIMGALGGCPGMEVTLGFDPDKPGGAFYIDGGAIEFWIAPQQKAGGGES